VQICTKSFVGWAFAPDPTRELTAFPQTSAAVRGLTSKARREREGKGGEKGKAGGKSKGRKKEEREKREKRKGRKGREREFSPPTFQMLPPPMVHTKEHLFTSLITFMYLKSEFTRLHLLKFLCKYDNFPRRYIEENKLRVFFIETRYHCITRTKGVVCAALPMWAKMCSLLFGAKLTINQLLYISQYCRNFHPIISSL